MPKEITHLILAHEVARTYVSSNRPHKKNVGAEIYWITENYPHEYCLGAVSPDIFFYDLKMPWESGKKPRGGPWGDRIHGTEGEDTLRVIESMLSILTDISLQQQLTGYIFSREEREKLFAFSIGYATHVALDMTLHPIVYFFAGNYYDPHPEARSKAETRHRAMETILDLWTLKQIQEGASHFKSVQRITTDKKTQDLINRFYTRALFMSFAEENSAHENISEQQLLQVIKRSLRKQAFMNKIFANKVLATWYQRKNLKKMDKNAVFSSLLYPAETYDEFLLANEKGFRIDMLNSYKNPVSGQNYKIRRGYLLKKAIARSHRFLKAMLMVYTEKITPAASRNVLRGYSLNNGMLGVPTREMKHFDPLPINGNFIITGEI